MNNIQSLSPYYTVPGLLTTGSHSITVIAGTQGPTGEQGIQGIQGDPGICTYPSINTTSISEDYTASIKDYYIGIIAEDPITLNLPEVPSDGTQIIIKYELGTPAGQRITTVTTLDGSLIDGSTYHKIKAPYRMLHVLFRNNEWHIIGKI